MGAFSRWLLHEDQKEVFEFFYATALNIVFLALAALLLWPVGRAAMALRLAKGFWVLWVVLAVTGALLVTFRRVFRIDMDTHFDAYVLSALAVSGLIQAGWSAFAALTVGGFAAGASVWAAAALYLTGLLSCCVAFAAVSAYYTGSIYRTVNLPLGVAGFVLFSAWPSAGRAAFGWFFGLFEESRGAAGA